MAGAQVKYIIRSHFLQLPVWVDRKNPKTLDTRKIDVNILKVVRRGLRLP